MIIEKLEGKRSMGRCRENRLDSLKSWLGSTPVSEMIGGI